MNFARIRTTLASLPRTLSRPDRLDDALAAQAAVLRGVRAPLRSRFIWAGGHRIHYLEAGDGPPIVFLHGHGGGAAVWHGVIDGLVNSHRVLAVDLLGWGCSERAPFTGRTAEEAQAWWVESLEAWRAEMGIERFTLVGHSLGGFVAASYALAHGNRLSHLVLEDAAGMWASVRLPTSLYFRVLGPQRFIRLCGPLGRRLVGWARQAEKNRTLAPAALPVYYHALATCPGSGASGERAFARLLSLRRWELPLFQQMRFVKVPTLLVWGEHDRLIAPLIGYLLRTRMPNAHLVLIPDAGHSPHAERPHVFVEALLAFLRQQPPVESRHVP